VTNAVVLDAGALDGSPWSPATRALIQRIVQRSGEVWCCAVNLSEVCRGRDRTAAVESFLRRGIPGVGVDGAIHVRNTDEVFAKRVGALLHAASLDSSALADAHVVALCAEFDAVIVVTTDSEDIMALADSVPAVRVVTRRP
jgi:predicted nucleic acid-binding protein